MLTDDSIYIATLSGVPQCEGSSSFRWSWGRQLLYLSATTSGAEAGKQEPTHKWNRCVKRPFIRVCNRAIRHGQTQPLYLCTFRFLQIPEECLAADHRCFALSRMLTECWRRQPTPSLDGMARTGPQPHVCFEMWFGCTSFQVTASMCEKAVFWRCSAARPPLGTERQQSQYTRYAVCPPGATHSSQDYTFVQRKTSWLWTLIRFCTLLIE